MNKKFLADNVGKRLRLVPAAYHGTTRVDDEWRVDAYENSTVVLRHEGTGATYAIGDDSVHSYRSDPARGEGHLILMAQLFVDGDAVRHTPMTRPGEQVLATPTSLLSEAYLEVSLDCHSWKSAFLNIHGWDIPRSPIEAQLDVWDVLTLQCVPSYSVDNYKKYHPVFLAPLIVVKTRFDRALGIFQHVLPHDFQAELVRGARQLGVEHSSYVRIPALVQNVASIDVESLFQGRFIAVLGTLKRISRDADKRRAELAQA